MRIAVSAESTIDLKKDQLERYDISVIPYQVVLGDKCYKDGEITTEELFKFVEESKTLPKTNALNEFEYTEYFEDLRKRYDAVVHIALSGAITSSCNNAIRAGNNVPNVYVVDSKSLSAGIALLAVYARELADAGEDAEEIAKKLNDRTDKIQGSFVIERLDYLFKGGRCNSLQLLGANLLKIRPRIVLKNGKMGMDKKYKGPMAKVVEKYGTEILQDYDKPDLKRAFIAYTTATSEMLEQAYEVCRRAGFKEILEAQTGVTVASHCGANTLGIMYFNDAE